MTFQFKRHFFKVIASLGLVLLANCQSRMRIRPSEDGDRLFPFGLYRHDVSLTVREGDKEHFHRFFGIMELKPDHIRLIGISPFGTTVFRLTDDLPTNHISTEIYFPPLQKLESRIQEFYLVLKSAVELPAKQSPRSTLVRVTSRTSLGYPEKVRTLVKDQPIELEIVAYRSDQVPQIIKLNHSRFTVRVDIQAYEHP